MANEVSEVYAKMKEVTEALPWVHLNMQVIEVYVVTLKINQIHVYPCVVFCIVALVDLVVVVLQRSPSAGCCSWFWMR